VGASGHRWSGVGGRELALDRARAVRHCRVQRGGVGAQLRKVDDAKGRDAAAGVCRGRMSTGRQGKLAGIRLPFTGRSGVASIPGGRKAPEYYLGGRENLNRLRIPVEHSKAQSAVDDGKYRFRCRSSIDRHWLEQGG
jgi:hypothetical protein